MKKILFALCAVVILAMPTFAQTNTHPTQIDWVYDDSTNTIIWNVGVTLDSDTSIAFSVFRMPETGLGFQFYWNDTDTGTIVAILQQNSFLIDLGFEADSAAAVDYISSWAIADSVILDEASGRGTQVWNPSLVGPAERARLILKRRGGTDTRVLAVARIRQD